MARRATRVSYRDFFTPADHAFVNWTVRNNGTLLADPRLRRSMGDEVSAGLNEEDEVESRGWRSQIVEGAGDFAGRQSSTFDDLQQDMQHDYDAPRVGRPSCRA